MIEDYIPDDNSIDKRTEKYKNFDGEVYGSNEPPPSQRNVDCSFTQKVFWYLLQEYGVNIVNYNYEVQRNTMDLLDYMKMMGKNVPNTAQRIAYETLPLV